RNADLETDFLEVACATRLNVEVLADQRVELSREQREELCELKVEVSKLGSTLAEMRERGTDFRFAREKDAVADLPNFLPQRRVVTPTDCRVALNLLPLLWHSLQRRTCCRLCCE